jgi:hypothetical protein
MFGHVHLNQLSFYETIITFFGKMHQLCVHGALNIIFFYLEILNLSHLIFANAMCSIKPRKLVPMVAMTPNVVWENHDIRDVGSDGFT